ncbi:MAG: 50S ribosomal protein L9 [Eubacteriales bacterium]
MKVILVTDVKGQGKKDQMIEVSEGYARNFLLPKKLAIVADTKAINEMKRRQESKQFKLEEERAAAAALAAQIEAAEVTVYANPGADGKLYGAVTTKDIAEAMECQHKLVVDKRKITIDTPIKALGRYELKIKLYEEVSATLHVTVAKQA